MKYKILSLVIVLFAFTNIHSQVSNENLAAYYPFNGNANDESGNGHDGVIYGVTLTTDRFNNVNSAYQFDNSDYIEVESHEDLNPEDQLSISLWLYIDSYTNRFTPVIHKGGSNTAGFTNREYLIYIEDNSRIYVECAGDVQRIYRSIATPLPLKEWVYYACVVDRENHVVQLYLNGEKVAESEDVNSFFRNNSYNMKIGGWDESNAEYAEAFNGKIDDVKIYKRALSSSEIDELYNIENPGQSVNINGNMEICQGEQDISYTASDIDDAVSYTWSYSGIGITITQSANTISADFSEDATSGNLNVTVELSDGSVKTSSFNINVKQIPTIANNIIGESEVCLGVSNVNYIVPENEGATLYSWNFSGEGATILGSTNSILISFDNDATAGVLSVYGVNECGVGEPSDLPITPVECTGPLVQSLNISGYHEICQGEQGAYYIASNIEDAIDYTWSYTGAGITISESANIISADFSNDATEGNLIVSVQLRDGTIHTSDIFEIFINPLPLSAGGVFGDEVICLGQDNVNYSIQEIEEASTYQWEYSGEGAVISGNTNSIKVSFNKQATDGYLTAYGVNDCGYGEPANLLINLRTCSNLPENFKIPNSFSPNGDNINDFYIIGGLEENFSLIIFDRSGKKLYESSNYQNDWDGSDLDGNTLSSGTYWYILRIPGIPTTFDGFIYLKR